ncbi:MAG TPA: porin [Geothrix sp.]|nr:porin [Geothrix sp.]
MKTRMVPGLAWFLAWGTVQAQDFTLNALVEAWYVQPLDANLRLNAAAKPAGSAIYYDGLGAGRFAESTFAVKRTEIYLNGVISRDLSWSLMFDPNNSTASVGNNLLADALITWVPLKGLSVKVGQTKMPAAYEGSMVGSRDLLFFDRGQLNRLLGEVRDRCLWLVYSYGDAKTFLGRLNLAVSNGTSDDGSKGKNNDLNAQKDWTFRFDGEYRGHHKFGLYYREGVTNLKDATLTVTIPATWTVGPPTADQVKSNRDKTTLAGLFYAFDDATWHADLECASGLLGRRFPALFPAGAADSVPRREHLDQKYLGYVLSGVYKLGPHWLTARYDRMNYNSGNDWYTASNPYRTDPATGLPTGNDYTPVYTETTLGYTYLFAPTRPSLGKLKVNYIRRSRNFLAPRSGQTGAQGGDSLVTSLMLAF